MSRFYLPLILILYLFLNLTSLLDKPPIWPDEPLYTDIASNFITQHRLGSDLWQGLVPQVESMALWNPPLYFLALAGWLKLFGFTITTQRLLSTFLGGISLLSINQLITRLSPKSPPFIRFVILLSHILDFQFLKGTRLSRPEILVLPLALASFLILKKPISRLKLISSGIILGLACLAHPFALFFLPIIIAYTFTLRQPKTILSLLVGFASPIIIWLLSIHSQWSNLLYQLTLASARKSLETPWFVDIFSKSNLLLTAITLSQLGLTVYYLRRLHHSPRSKYFLVTLLYLVIMVFFSRQLWYLIFLLPVLYLGILYLFPQPHKFSQLPRIYLLLMVLNLLYSSITLYASLTKPISYPQYVAAVEDLLPPNSSVFLTAIPDPYYGLVTSSKSFTLKEIPAYQLDDQQYLSILQNIDYIVYSGNQNPYTNPHILDTYIDQNTEKITTLNSSNQTPVSVIKLKPALIRTFQP